MPIRRFRIGRWTIFSSIWPRWLADEVAESFANQEGDAVINGDGTNRPTGMLNTTPVTTADAASPLRDADTYRIVAIDSDTLGSPQSPGVTAEGLIRFRLRAQHLLSRWRDLDHEQQHRRSDPQAEGLRGQILWADGLALGQPARCSAILSKSWEEMPDIGLNDFPVAFGNSVAAYLLMERLGLRITRDEVPRRV